jgi:hypothetical protein
MFARWKVADAQERDTRVADFGQRVDTEVADFGH